MTREVSLCAHEVPVLQRMTTPADQLAPEWDDLSLERREQRRADHELANGISGETVNAVQDEVIDRQAPESKFSR